MVDVAYREVWVHGLVTSRLYTVTEWQSGENSAVSVPDAVPAQGVSADKLPQAIKRQLRPHWSDWEIVPWAQGRYLRGNQGGRTVRFFLHTSHGWQPSTTRPSREIGQQTYCLRRRSQRIEERATRGVDEQRISGICTPDNPYGLSRQQFAAVAMAVRHGRPSSDSYVQAHIRDSDEALAQKRMAEARAAANYDGPSLRVSRPGDSIPEAEFRRQQTHEGAWHNRTARSLQAGLQVAAGELAIAGAIVRGTGLLARVAGKAGAARAVAPDSARVLAARRAYLNKRFRRTGDINLDINIRGRQQVATDFYRSQGYAPADIPSHLKGIDFTQPVDVVAINGSKRLYQFRTPSAPQGSYYSFDRAVRPSELGVSPYGLNRASGLIVPKVQDAYVTTGPFPMLRSTSAKIMDTWSAPGSSYYTFGGARQLFSGNKAALAPIAP